MFRAGDEAVSLPERSDFPRQTEMTEQIAAIRRDLDVENRVVRKERTDRCADLVRPAKE